MLCNGNEILTAAHATSLRESHPTKCAFSGSKIWLGLQSFKLVHKLFLRRQEVNVLRALLKGNALLFLPSDRDGHMSLIKLCNFLFNIFIYFIVSHLLIL